MKLYHCHDARSLRPLWTLEELGIPYELDVLPFPPRFFRKEYLAVNPLGTVPFFEDGETRMTESSAICQYLVERYGSGSLALRPDDPEYGAWLNWLHQADSTLTFPQAVMLRYRHLEPEARRLPQAVEDYRAFFLGRLRWLARHLEGREYLCAGRFTIADICIGYALYLGTRPLVAADDAYPPVLRDYLERLTGREAFRRAAAIGEPTPGA
jgi:glutathione S-transferase